MHEGRKSLWRITSGSASGSPHVSFNRPHLKQEIYIDVGTPEKTDEPNDQTVTHTDCREGAQRTRNAGRERRRKTTETPALIYFPRLHRHKQTSTSTTPKVQPQKLSTAKTIIVRHTSHCQTHTQTHSQTLTCSSDTLSQDQPHPLSVPPQSTTPHCLLYHYTTTPVTQPRPKCSHLFPWEAKTPFCCPTSCCCKSFRPSRPVTERRSFGCISTAKRSRSDSSRKENANERRSGNETGSSNSRKRRCRRDQEEANETGLWRL